MIRQEHGCEEQVHNRFRYTGEQYDPLTGQYYLRARYYNPVIARFTQEDTYYGDGLNLYTYCQNNPILYHDPPDLQRSVTLMQSQSRICIISTRNRATVHRMPRNWQTVKSSMVKKQQRST